MRHHAGDLRRAVVGYQVSQPDCGLTQRAMSCEKASTSSSCAPVGNTAPPTLRRGPPGAPRPSGRHVRALPEKTDLDVP